MNNKKTDIKKILKIAATGVSCAVFVLALILFFSVMTARIKGGVPRVFGYSFHVVMTDSMTPEINVGDLVIAKKVDESEIKVGDDIVFVSPNPEHNGIYLVHRVVRINSDGSFVTQGVKKNAPEDKYPVFEIEGKRVATSKSLGSFFGGVGSNKNLLFILVIAIVGVVIVFETVNIVLNIVKKKKGIPDEKEVAAKENAERAKRIAALEEEIRKLSAEKDKKNPPPEEKKEEDN